MFSDCPIEILTALSEVAEARQYIPNDIITRTGANIDLLFVIAEGALDAVLSGEDEVSMMEGFRLGPGDIFSFASLSERSSKYLVKAISASEVISFETKRLQSALQDHPELLNRINRMDGHSLSKMVTVGTFRFKWDSGV